MDFLSTRVVGVDDVASTGATCSFSSHQLDLVEDLCEDVVIIDHGRVVLCGRASTQLRAAVPQRFVDIRYRGAAPDWSTLPAVDRRRVAAMGTRSFVSIVDADLNALVDVVAAGADIVSFDLSAADAVGAVPGGGGGRMNGLRQSWLVASAGAARAQPVPRLPRIAS